MGEGRHPKYDIVPYLEVADQSRDKGKENSGTGKNTREHFGWPVAPPNAFVQEDKTTWVQSPSQIAHTFFSHLLGGRRFSQTIII